MSNRRLKLDNRGDTLIEVTFALVILGMVLVSSSLVAIKGLQTARTAQERTTISDKAQEQMEALRSFRENHTWTEFLSGGGAIHYNGVLNASSASCKVATTCLHMNLASTDAAVTEFVPAGGYVDGNVATSYMEMLIEPGPGATPEYVDVTLYYGFESTGGGINQSNHIKTRMTNLDRVGVSNVNCTVPQADIVFSLDASGSMDTTWVAPLRRSDKLEQVISTFIDNANVSPGTNHEAIIKFNTGAQLVSNFSGDPATLHAAMGNYRPFANGTQFTPAITMAGSLFSGPTARPTADRILIHVSDGVQSAGDTPAAAVAAADVLKNPAGLNVKIFTILIMRNTEPQYGAAALTMSNIAGNGGTFGTANDPADLDALMNVITSAVVSC